MTLKKSLFSGMYSLLNTTYSVADKLTKILILLATAVTLIVNFRITPVLESIRAINTRVDVVEGAIGDISEALKGIDAKLNQACERLARIEGKLE